MSSETTEVLPAKRLGRPPLLEVRPELKDQILGYIAEGAYMQTAFRAAGVSDETYYLWLEQAEHGKPIFKDFIGALKKAEAEAELKMTKEMLTGKDRFLPCATFLERRFRDRWGRSDKHTVDANVTIRVEQVDYGKLAKSNRQK